MSLRIRRGTETERSGIVFDMGEIVWTTNEQQLWVGDGLTQGGVNILANSAGDGLSYNPTTRKLEFAGPSYTTDDIAEGTSVSRQYFSVERAQDAVAAALTAGVHTNISFVYTTTQDNANRIDATVTLDGVGIASVSADTTPTLGGNLGLAGHNITGTGNVNITGSVTATSLISNDIHSTAGGISVGSATNPSPLHVYSSTEPLSIFQGITDNVTPPQVMLEFSRGTLASPTTVQVGDQLGGILTKAYDGTVVKSVSNIFTSIAADAVLSDANPKSDVYVATASGGSSFALFEFRGDGTFVAPQRLFVGDGSAGAPALTFQSDASQDTGLFHPADGVVCIATNAQEKVRVDGGGMRVDGFMKVKNVNGTLPNPPEAGMIVLDGTTFKGYDGSSWVPLS